MITILRDTAIIWGLTFLSGFVIGIGAAAGNVDSSKLQAAVAAGNLIFGIVGFTIVGCLTKTDRFKHMTKVVLCLWLVGLTNVLFLGYAFVSWALSLIFLFVAMGAGGGVSLLFVPAPAKTRDPAVQQGARLP
jgi:hypothetical protein